MAVMSGTSAVGSMKRDPGPTDRFNIIDDVGAGRATALVERPIDLASEGFAEDLADEEEDDPRVGPNREEAPKLDAAVVDPAPVEEEIAER